jgi:hypothetical protein
MPNDIGHTSWEKGMGSPRISAPSPLADSPWFWLAVFSGMGLVALLAIGAKYDRRQVEIELEFQGRERAAYDARLAEVAGDRSPSLDGNFQARESAPGDPASQPLPYSAPGDPQVPLWPIQFLAGAVFLVALSVLVWKRYSPVNKDQERFRGRSGRNSGRCDDALH